jgi:UDP-3-O-[3-hydroxymyristoyl] glucosamine N-acyltransferase
MTRSGPISYSLREIAERFGGELTGDPGIEVTRVATLEAATPDAIAFLANERYLPQLKTTRAAAVIVGVSARSATRLPRIVCANPYAFFARVSTLFNPPPPARPGTHPSAVIDPTATVAGDVEIGPCAVIGRNARIGAGCVIGSGCHIGEGAMVGSGSRLHPNVTVYHDCAVGSRVILHSGVVIGADGFGIAMEEGRWIKVPQIGRVVIGDDVEIGANTTVDRGALGDTVIEDGVKLDNQIQVGHNVRIGAHTAIAACVGIAGSTRIGSYCKIGGASGIAGHLTIADRVEISAFTLIAKSIDQAGTYTGVYPFEPHSQWRKNAVHVRHLADLANRIRTLEKKPSQTRKRSKP